MLFDAAQVRAEQMGRLSAQARDALRHIGPDVPETLELARAYGRALVEVVSAERRRKARPSGAYLGELRANLARAESRLRGYSASHGRDAATALAQAVRFLRFDRGLLAVQIEDTEARWDAPARRGPSLFA